MLEQLFKALELTYRNIISLFEDATILYDNKKFGRSYTLYHLCFEEAGRFYLLYGVFIDYLTGKIKKKEINYRYLKVKGYDDHLLKINVSYEGMKRAALMLKMMEKNQSEDIIRKKEIEREMEEIAEGIDNIRKSNTELNKRKNAGLYVTFEDNRFHLPDRTIKVTEFYDMQRLSRLNKDLISRVMEFAESKGGFSQFERLLKEGE